MDHVEVRSAVAFALSQQLPEEWFFDANERPVFLLPVALPLLTGQPQTLVETLGRRLLLLQKNEHQWLSAPQMFYHSCLAGAVYL